MSSKIQASSNEMDLAAKKGKNVTRDAAAVTVKNKIQGIDLKKGRP